MKSYIGISLFVIVLLLAETKPLRATCDQPCDIVIDVVLVLDESGSISLNEFDQLRNFALAFVGLFTISPTNANVGIVLFDDHARVLLPLSDDPAAVVGALNGMTRGGSTTNTQDGIYEARLLLDGSTRNPDKQIMVVITDGVANQCDICYSTNPSAAAIHEAGLFKNSAIRTLFGIAVGDSVNQQFITDISSPGSSFSVSDFADLENIITDLIDAACYQAPQLHIPADISVPCNSSTSPAVTGVATASGWCDGCGPSTPTYNDIVIPGRCPQERTINRTWTTTDNCGGYASGVQRIYVVDNVPPTIHAPLGVILECPADTSVQALGNATAIDACDSTPTISYSDVIIRGLCPNEYRIIRTFTAVDDCGNSASVPQIINVVDTKPPVVTDVNNFCLWPPNHKYYCISNLTYSDVIISSDACSGDTFIKFQGCSSNQPDNSNGDGNTSNDCYYNSATDTLCIRAERAGNIPTNRVYSANLAVSDYLNPNCANYVNRTLTVTVPHDQRDPQFRNCRPANTNTR